ncbi:MAG: carboxypeptidase-like regulatory domain-containing protein [Dehalococcoidia bacterium]
MHERYFDLRITDNGRQRLRSRKILLQFLVSFVLLFSLVLPLSVAGANGSFTMETEVSSFPTVGSDVTAFGIAGGALCQRELPDTVTAGEEFAVTVTFAAPAHRFHAIGLTDLAPAGWDVSVDVAWTEPEAMLAHTPEPEMAAYIWAGPYAAGVEFTAVYQIKVPVDAEPGTYKFSGSLKYYVEPHPAPSYGEAITGDIQVDVVGTAAAPMVTIMGVTKEADGAILSGAVVILYQNGEGIGNVVSDENGNYEFEFSELGDYDVVASKEGFRAEAQSISVTEPVTYSLDFGGDHGLVPDAPSKSYVLACTDLWRFGESSSQLSTSRLLELISAWKHPYLSA